MPRAGVVPAGRNVRVRLIEELSEESKSGDVLQGMTADSEAGIPGGARALLSLTSIQIRDENLADVTIRLTELVSKSGRVPVTTAPVQTTLKRRSDIDVLARSITGIIGGAIGAARASSGRGAGSTAGGLVAGASANGNQETLLFTITEPLNVAGIQW